MRIRVAPAAALGSVAAEEVSLALRTVLATRGTASLAISGGRTPTSLFAVLAGSALPWSAIDVFQVDERIAPDGHPDRNLTSQKALFSAVSARFHPMTVDPVDVAGYAARLPSHFDCVHLGLGDDGHTASLIPGDPVLQADGPVALTGVYQGRRRMTLTLPVLNRARAVVWLVAGASKRAVVARLLVGDPTIPAGRVTAPGVLVLDPEACP